MKAAVYYKTGAPDVFKYEERPDPVLAPMQVLVEVKAISIEGGDVLNRHPERFKDYDIIRCLAPDNPAKDHVPQLPGDVRR